MNPEGKAERCLAQAYGSLCTVTTEKEALSLATGTSDDLAGLSPHTGPWPLLPATLLYPPLLPQPWGWA